MTGARIAVPLGLAVVLAVAALAVLPRAYEAERLLSSRDDPVALADRAVARSLNLSVAEREINAALAANDADGLLGPEPAHQPALMLGTLGETPSRCHRKRVHRRFPPTTALG